MRSFRRSRLRRPYTVFQRERWLRHRFHAFHRSRGRRVRVGCPARLDSDLVHVYAILDARTLQEMTWRDWLLAAGSILGDLLRSRARDFGILARESMRCVTVTIFHNYRA